MAAKKSTAKKPTSEPKKAEPKKAEPKKAEPKKAVTELPRPAPVKAAPVKTAPVKKPKDEDGGDEGGGPRMPRQREIAVSEFFSKNRHLLGFDSPHKALMTAVREAVDNALDACEEAGILPEILVEITELSESRYRIRVEDNGPGIPKAELGKIFAKLLYGSKFHRLRQSRGQQGIGISAAVMYSQMTTGEPAHVWSKLKGAPKGAAQHIRVFIDTAKNQPKLDHEGTDESDWWKQKVSGTAIELTMSAQMKGGRHGVEAYLKQTALANPHARVLYKHHKIATKAQQEKGAPAVSTETLDVPRVINVPPKQPEEIKPHPHGVELGTLQRMLQDAGKQKIGAFLNQSFSRVTSPIATELVRAAHLTGNENANALDRTKSEALYNAIQNQKLMGPPTSCLSPIGEEALIKGLYSLFGDRKNLEDDDDLEHLTPDKQKPSAAQALLAQIAEAATTSLSEAAAQAGEKPAAVDKGKKLPGKKAAPQLSLFQKDAQKDGAKDAAGEGVLEAASVEPAPKLKAKIETDEDGGQIIALGDDVFVTAVTRPPAVYRGNPFQAEVGILYSRELPGDELAKVFRFANRVPLLYQASACAMTKAVVSAPWRSYEVQQAKGAPPTGPIVILVHIASVWVPYTSESKEAIAHYPEVLKEMRLAVMEAGRRLQRFLRRKKRDLDEQKKRDYITKYLDPIGEALRDILGLSKQDTQETLDSLKIVLEKSRNPASEAERRARKNKSKSKSPKAEAKAEAGAEA
jgi:DNA topoisomerase VI subunit B